jgi:hypothetical protein
LLADGSESRAIRSVTNGSWRRRSCAFPSEEVDATSRV